MGPMTESHPDKPPVARPVIKDFTSIKPMSMLVRGRDRPAIVEVLLWKYWNGV